MLNGYKIIGVCVTRIHDETHSRLIQSLYRETDDTDYRIIAFNSFHDFYNKDLYGDGAKAIYKAVNFDMLDILVIVYRSFHDKELVDELIAKAREKDVPVLLLFGERRGCFSVMKSCAGVFSELVEHVITHHSVRRISFIAGVKGEEDSEERLRCCSDVMERHGLYLMDEDIAYCDYWDVPVERTIDKWCADKRIPEAIICANDTMAIAACDRLLYHGFKVPDDVIVTGFDGIEIASYHSPRLTTCSEDIEGLAKQCFQIIQAAVEQGEKPFKSIERYSLTLSESCGCGCEDDTALRKNASRLYSLVQSIHGHEDTIYDWADTLVENTDLAEFGEAINKNILPGSAVVLNSDFLVAARKNKITDPEEPFTDKMIVLSARGEDYVLSNQEVFDLSELYVDLGKKIEKNCIHIFQSIYVMDKVQGYYVVRTSDLTNVVHRVHRFFRVMNLAFGTMVGRLEREHLTSDIAGMKFRDTITDLMNVKGLESEFERRYDELRDKRVATSVYCIPQFRFIYENFGLMDAEEALNLVSEGLQLANPINTLIARLSENEFAVVNIEEPDVDMGEVITNAVAVFFSVVESYNDDIDKDYYVEVNCGCTVAEPGWNGDLSSFIKVARGEMYLNRMKTESEPVLKEHHSSEEEYRMFDVLVKKNLFVYHFQPIIDAHTGKIFAYEALMRTTGSIAMNPGQILDIAKEYRRLYDIELATFRNVLEYVSEHEELFRNKNIFINTIPGYFLRSADYEEISSEYQHIFSRCVIEITEQNDISDEELMKIKSLGGEGSSCQLAIDDYGAGYSNIVNLLRYKPQVIKIDRFLISGVNADKDKQMFVRNIIDFAHSNQILTIAEGVETSEELHTVIKFGVDLIQGFYTARPAPFPLQELPQQILDEISEANGADYVQILKIN